MCLIFLALNIHPKYKLIVAGNRDEFYDRRTAPASFWEDQPDLLAGRDLEAMGTWLGITRTGRIAMLTNFRDVANIRSSAPSRGELVSSFLKQDVAPDLYMKQVSADGKLYNGFNLLTGTVDELWYYSNYGKEPRKLPDGFYGLSNHLLDTPWPKVVRGKARLKPFLSVHDPDPEVFFNVLFDEDVAADADLPQTGLPLEREKALSSMFIKTTGYGSRCSTVILVDRDNNVFFAERVYDPKTFEYSTHTFRFKSDMRD